MCLSITDCSGIVKKVAEKLFIRSPSSFFFLPSFLPTTLLPVCTSSFASCNTDPHSSFLHSSFPLPLPRHLPPLLRLSLPIRPFAAVASFFSIYLSLSLLAGTWTKKEVYKFARRNCHEKYGILSASKATLVAAWETPSRMGNEVPLGAAAIPPFRARSREVVPGIRGTGCWESRRF